MYRSLLRSFCLGLFNQDGCFQQTARSVFPEALPQVNVANARPGPLALKRPVSPSKLRRLPTAGGNQTGVFGKRMCCSDEPFDSEFAPFRTSPSAACRFRDLVRPRA